MRRVYDDCKYDEVSTKIMNIIRQIPADRVSEYHYGMYRARTSMIRDYIGRIVDVKFGKNEHRGGIGNNNAIELIVDSGSEEQICGLLHLTDDMFGSVICWVSDIDGGRRTETMYIHGCDVKERYKYERANFERGQYWR